MVFFQENIYLHTGEKHLVKVKYRTSFLITETTMEGDRVLTVQHICDVFNVGKAFARPQ